MRMRFFTGLLLLCITIPMYAAGVSPTEKGYELMEAKNYGKAIVAFEQALKETKTNDAANEIMEQLAIANLRIKNYVKSDWYFEQLITNGFESATTYLGYARMLQRNGHYEKAKAYFMRWGEFIGEPDSALQYMSFCENNTQLDKQYRVSSLASNRDEYNEFSPVFHPKGILVYTSDEPTEKIPTATDGRSVTQLYAQQIASEHKMAAPIAGTKLYNRGSATFTKDGNTMYYTGNVLKRVGVFTKQEPQYTLGIFKSTFDGYIWSKGEQIPLGDDKYNYAYPSLSEDGKTLVFASDQFGGMGGMDLYISHKSGELWTTPKNLGSAINTSENEAFPTVTTSEDTTRLHFASDGKPGYGGLDIYSCDIVDDIASNVSIEPDPVNSAYDDFGYEASAQESIGFISSNRNGSDDIFQFQQISGEPTKPVLKYLKTEENTSNETVDTESSEESDETDTTENSSANEATADSETNSNSEDKGDTADSADTADDKSDTTADDEHVSKTDGQSNDDASKKSNDENTSDKSSTNTSPKTDGNTTYADASELDGYYFIVYSVKNNERLEAYRDQNFKDAMLIKNANGFYHIGYFLSEDKASAKSMFKQKIQQTKGWLYKF